MVNNLLAYDQTIWVATYCAEHIGSTAPLQSIPSQRIQE